MKAIRDYIGTLIDIEPSQLHSASTRPRLPGLTTPCTDPDRLYGASDAAGPAGCSPRSAGVVHQSSS